MSAGREAGEGDKPLERGARDARGRFLKGAPSANPYGAPRKAERNRSRTAMMDEKADMIMRLARMPAARRSDGTIVNRFEKAIDTLYKLGTDAEKPDVAALRDYVRITTAAAEDEQRIQTEILTNAIADKERLTREIEEAHRAGRDPPKELPHPDDILIDLNEGTITIVGPQTLGEQRYLEACVALRDLVLTQAEQLDGADGSSLEMRRLLEHRVLQIEKGLPPRLRKLRNR